MAKRSGGYGGPMSGNMNQLVKQAQKMQAQIEEQQANLEEMEFEATSGGGAVKVVVNGKKQIISITIDPEAVDPDDVEMLQDMIMAATNEALNNCDKESKEKMSKITGGIGGLGGGGLF